MSAQQDDKPLNRRCRRCLAHGKAPKRCGADNCKPYKNRVAKDAAAELQFTTKWIRNLRE